MNIKLIERNADAVFVKGNFNILLHSKVYVPIFVNSAPNSCSEIN